jgi:hypothetical protein
MGAVTSSNAVLTVRPDTNGPTIDYLQWAMPRVIR